MQPRKRQAKPEPSLVEQLLNTHDPLEELDRAERAEENHYFRKLDQELITALREKNAEEIELAIRTYTRMRCPTCGEPLESTLDRGVSFHACPECGGIWLNKGEWEGRVGPDAPGWLQRFFTGLVASKS